MSANKYTYDIDAACRYLRANARGKSIGKCATYVKNAMAAAGIPYVSGYNGCDMGRYCRMYGFQQVLLSVNGRNPVGALKGDVMSVYHGQYGHTAIYDGTMWISDFKLNNCIPYSGGWSNVTFWRWTDHPIYSGYEPTNIPVISANDAGPGSMFANSYSTISGTGGNIFENAGENAFKQAGIINDIGKTSSKKTNTRIYSTNDATIVLDELSLPMNEHEDTSTNNNQQTETSA